MIATAVESMSSFQDADTAFTADAPALSPTEPALVFVGAPRGRLLPLSRQNHAPDTPFSGGPFVGRRAEAAIACGQVRCAAEDRLMPIERRRPQGDFPLPSSHATRPLFPSRQRGSGACLGLCMEGGRP